MDGFETAGRIGELSSSLLGSEKVELTGQLEGGTGIGPKPGRGDFVMSGGGLNLSCWFVGLESVDDRLFNGNGFDGSGGDFNYCDIYIVFYL